MKYKLSNIASKTLIEDFTKLKLKYPNIYKPKRNIDGLKEQSVSIITMENPNIISQGIWGILPHNFKDSWGAFQKIKNTIHTNKNELFNNILYKEALFKRRCLILATGFYIYKIKNNKIIRYLVEKKNREPFYLAGIYNVTDDGFKTCTIINTETEDVLDAYDNIYNCMPLQIPKIFKNIWLDNTTKLDNLKYMISKPYLSNLIVQKIAS
ncbi:SOS response-associated peptidase family protein [Tenacibaculum sp. IB213877]|uniref:SOS response-associated peptidase family protein n=1 Tax=Tenacibaculum sp. IB213877 TaxID=3097351 RepID=UPI002A5A363F|nr:SOS response-associated peptidase family protein [Tenacibaculum sp. IB213877]MDY0779527.1 SOS response-associated peptidase family protein [Tenacibaculum sp. IB213877]